MTALAPPWASSPSQKTTTRATTLALLSPSSDQTDTTSQVLDGSEPDDPKAALVAASFESAEQEGLVDDAHYVDRFGGVGRLYSNPDLSADTVLSRLRQAVVVVVGLGGVGSWTAEALCRSGIGHLVLIDLDDICISNTNRQLHATTSAIGQFKTDAMKARLLDIHPGCQITLVHDFVSEENVQAILTGIGRPITALVDAIDESEAKAAILAACTDLGIPAVTCGATAGQRNAQHILRGDLTEVDGDRLLSNSRRLMRKKHGFPAGLSMAQKRATKRRVRKWKIPCVYTLEPPPPKATQAEDTSSFRLCDGSLGTACFVTGTYGFALASLCVDMIALDELVPPRR